MKLERWIWVGGWGLPADWLRKCAEEAHPFAHHTVLPPHPTVIRDIEWNRFDHAGGYSLGAFLLLKESDTMPLPALLLAPFFAYPAEAGLGGKIRRAQIRVLLRWFQREPFDALADFYQRAELDLARPDTIPYPPEDLAWGLRQLVDGRVPARLPAGWRCLVGDQDSLLDAGILTDLEPRLEIVPGAGHHPAPLMRAAFGK